jgi:hypothetical protein
MRCMLDWTCTPTTLDFFQWLTLESIYSVLYQRQVTLAYRRRYGLVHSSLYYMLHVTCYAFISVK